MDIMEPKTISEQIMFSTLRIVSSNSVGTGFFFNFIFPENKSVPIIITNKHVINNNQKEEVEFNLHLENTNNIFELENKKMKFITNWYFHPEQDLCFCFFNPLLQKIKEEEKKDVFYIPINENLILGNEKLRELSAIEDVIMVGYPSGLWDEKNNLPLFRRGITSSHPAIDFNRKNIGAIDMACFHGSSGSPIFIMNEGGFTDKKGNTYLGGNRLIFLGILFEGPRVNSRGDLIIENISTNRKISAITPTPINLGYYIKSSEILYFKSVINELISKK